MYRLPAKMLVYFIGSHLFTLKIHFAHPDKGKAHVSQRSQIARSAQRTLLINNRDDIIIKKVDQPLNGAELHP